MIVSMAFVEMLICDCRLVALFNIFLDADLSQCDYRLVVLFNTVLSTFQYLFNSDGDMNYISGVCVMCLDPDNPWIVIKHGSVFCASTCRLSTVCSCFKELGIISECR